MNQTIASKAYATVGVESGALAADPHKLISMLYQGALLAVAKAKNGMMNKNVAAKGAAISKAISIIDDGLNASLDKKVGGELAQNLSSLYDYMCRRLLVANLNNDMAALDEVARLLNDLKGAWESIRPAAAPSDAAARLQPPAAKASPVYAVPAAAPPQAKTAAPQPQVKAAPIAAAQPQVRTAPGAAAPAPVATVQPKAAAVAPAKPASPPALPPQQQRVLNKVQSLYGRV